MSAQQEIPTKEFAAHRVLKKVIGRPVLVPEFPQFTSAIGAALYAMVKGTS